MKTSIQRYKTVVHHTLGAALISCCLFVNPVFAGEGWLLMAPPADTQPVVKFMLNPKGHNLSLVGLQNYAEKLSGLESPPPLTKWRQRRAFDSAEACENYKSGYREFLNLSASPTEADIEKSKLPIDKSHAPEDVLKSKVTVVGYLQDWLHTQEHQASRCVPASMLLQK